MHKEEQEEVTKMEIVQMVIGCIIAAVLIIYT